VEVQRFLWRYTSRADGLDPREEEAAEGLGTMALSPKMLAVLQKVEAARAEFFAGLQASTERDAEQERAQKAARQLT
jgi:hypothetical protein